MHKTKEAAQREADIARLDDYRRRAEAASAADVAIAVNGGGTTTGVSS